MDRRRPRARPRVRRARRRDPRPHGDRRTSRATWTCCARLVGDDEAHLRRRLLRLLPRRDLRQPLPGPRARARRRRRARPDRLVDRPRRRGADAAVLDAAAQRRGRAGDAAGVLPALRRRRRRAARSRATPPPASRRSPSGCARSPSRSRLRRRHDARRSTTRPDRHHARARCTTRSVWPDFAAASWPTSRRRRARSALGAPRRGASPRAGRATGRRAQRGIEPHYTNFLEGFPGVACADSDNPRAYAAWSVAGALADAALGYFGRLWTWASSICAEWPGADADRYTGPVRPHAPPTRCWSSATASTRPRRYQGARHRPRPAAALGAADRRRLGPHVAVPLVLRRRGDRALPDRRRDAATRHGVPAGRGAVHHRVTGAA